MVLDQGYWPETTLTPPSDEAIQYDIRMTKEMGFNGARKHQKMEDPRFLYWADKMGLLVSAEMANAYLLRRTTTWRASRASGPRRWSATTTIPRSSSGSPINESWGVPNLARSAPAVPLRALYTLTRSLDSTRLVIDNEGWEHTDMTDLFAVHDYARTGELLLQKYKDLGKPGMPCRREPRGADSGLQYNGSPLLPFRVRRHRVHSAGPPGAAGIVGILGRGEDG